MLKVILRYFKLLAIILIFIVVLSILKLKFTGKYQHFFELSYERYYKHNGPTQSIVHLMQQIQEGQTPSVNPINEFKYSYISDCQKCAEDKDIRILFVVKSFVEHFYRRQTIRQSWGFEQRFSDVNIRTVFLLGIKPTEPHLQQRVNNEHQQYRDIVQGQFVDDYYNLTIKTMMGLDWTIKNCKNVNYFFFVDDDYYVSTRNVLRFLKDPKNYPKHLETYDASSTNELHVNFWAGFVMHKSYPQRHVLGKSYVTLEEYPYSIYPPYVTGGAYIFSATSLRHIYFASIYTKFFK